MIITMIIDMVLASSYITKIISTINLSFKIIRKIIINCCFWFDLWTMNFMTIWLITSFTSDRSSLAFPPTNRFLKSQNTLYLYSTSTCNITIVLDLTNLHRLRYMEIYRIKKTRIGVKRNKEIHTSSSHSKFSKHNNCISVFYTLVQWELKV